MASTQACHSQNRSLQQPVRLQTCDRVRRARGVELAAGPEHRRNEFLVNPDQSNDQQRRYPDYPTQHAHSLRTARRRSSAGSVDGSGTARTTRDPAGNCSHIAASACRNCRCRRCLVTEPPIARPATTVARGESSPATKCSTTPPDRTRRPCRMVSRTRDRGCSRLSRGSTSDRQASAALAAAGREDGPSGAGAHAQAEAVLLVTAPVVRLVRTLHVCPSRRPCGEVRAVGETVELAPIDNRRQ